jgi:gluconate kinase
MCLALAYWRLLSFLQRFGSLRLREAEDGDWFHPPRNIEMMRSGLALTAEDRRPWLDAIADFIDATRRQSRRYCVLSTQAQLSRNHHWKTH